MFAFLNDSHEANATVYTPREQMGRAEVLRQIGEIEEELKHRNPDWSERMASWEDSVRGDQPAWTVIRPEPEACSYGALRKSRNPPEGLSTRNLWGRFHGTEVGRSLREAARLAVRECAGEYRPADGLGGSGAIPLAKRDIGRRPVCGSGARRPTATRRRAAPPQRCG